MPSFIMKNGKATPELKEWLEAHKDEPFIRCDVEIESKHDRLRRSFHALIRAWFLSGEFSVQHNGKEVSSYEQLRDYYKLCGCDGVPEWYRFGSYYTKNREEISKHIEPNYHRFIVEDPKSWVDMSKKQKSKALQILLTEINLSQCNNQDVLSWVSKITKEFI